MTDNITNTTISLPASPNAYAEQVLYFAMPIIIVAVCGVLCFVLVKKIIRILKDAE